MKTEHTPEPMHEEIWLQCPNRDSMSEWYGEVTWAEEQINNDDTKYVRADIAELLTKQRDELLAALTYVIEDLELRASLKEDEEERGVVDIGDGAYTQAKAAIASVKEK